MACGWSVNDDRMREALKPRSPIGCGGGGMWTLSEREPARVYARHQQDIAPDVSELDLTPPPPCSRRRRRRFLREEKIAPYHSFNSNVLCFLKVLDLSAANYCNRWETMRRPLYRGLSSAVGVLGWNLICCPGLPQGQTHASLLSSLVLVFKITSIARIVSDLKRNRHASSSRIKAAFIRNVKR